MAIIVPTTAPAIKPWLIDVEGALLPSMFDGVSVVDTRLLVLLGTRLVVLIDTRLKVVGDIRVEMVLDTILKAVLDTAPEVVIDTTLDMPRNSLAIKSTRMEDTDSDLRIRC